MAAHPPFPGRGRSRCSDRYLHEIAIHGPGRYRARRSASNRDASPFSNRRRDRVSSPSSSEVGCLRSRGRRRGGGLPPQTSSLAFERWIEDEGALRAALSRRRERRLSGGEGGDPDASKGWQSNRSERKTKWSDAEASEPRNACQSSSNGRTERSTQPHVLKREQEDRRYVAKERKDLRPVQIECLTPAESRRVFFEERSRQKLRRRRHDRGQTSMGDPRQPVDLLHRCRQHWNTTRNRRLGFKGQSVEHGTVTGCTSGGQGRGEQVACHTRPAC